MFREEPVIERAWFKDGLAVALSAMARPSDIGVLIELFNDGTHGKTRIFFVRNLARSKNPEAFATLVRHRGNKDYAPEIEHRLKLKAKKLKSGDKPQ
jgi:hypothetical protein